MKNNPRVQMKSTSSIRYYLIGVCIVLFSFKSIASPPISTFNTYTLSELELKNLSVLSKMYGYARYFYPNEQEKKIDWLLYLEYAILQVKDSPTQEALQAHLTTLFQPLIPQISFSSSPSVSNSPEKTLSGTLYIRENRSFPYPCKEMTFGEIVKLPYREGLPIPDKLYSFQLSPRLYVHFPIALTQLPPKSKELVHIVKMTKKKKWDKMNYFTDPIYRIANAIISNNLITHFYPYWEEDQLSKDWEERCATHLQTVSECPNYPQYMQAAYTHLTRLYDTHILVRNGIDYSAMIGRYQPDYTPNDFTLCIIDHRLFVERSKRNDLKRGDEILTVNSTPIRDFIALKMRETPASHPKGALARFCYETAFKTYSKDSIIHLTVRNLSGKESEIRINPQGDPLEKIFPDAELIQKLENNIYKINLCTDSCNYKKFASLLPLLRQAKGVIIDLRGYPNFSAIPILSHFTDQTMAVGQIWSPSYYFPDHINVQWSKTTENNSPWYIYPAARPELWNKEKTSEEKPVEERINVPVVFLTDAHCGSYGETLMEMIKRYKLGTIIGEPTNGTNGNATHFMLKTVGFTMTSQKFKNGDGTQHHGIGTLPDIYTSQNINDFMEGTDTMLKKAIDILASKSD